MGKDINEMSLFDIFNKLLMHRWRILIITAIITLIGVVYVFSLPRYYTSTTTIVAENKSGNAASLGMLSSFGFMKDAEPNGITLELLSVIIQSTPFLLEFKDTKVEVYNLDQLNISLLDYLNKYQRRPWWKISLSNRSEFSEESLSELPYELKTSDIEFVKNIQDVFTVFTDKKNEIIQLSAISQDPLVSVILVDSLTHKIQKYLTRYQTQKAQIEFDLSIQIADSAKSRYYVLQNLYAQTLDKNRVLVSEEAKSKLQRLESEMNVAMQSYLTSATQVEVARTKLMEKTPVFTILDPPYLDLSSSRPNRKLICIVAFAIGMFIGVGSVIIGDLINLVLITFKPNKNENITSH